MLALALALASSDAHAAPGADLTTSITAPTASVYQSARWYVNVANGGTRDASAVSVTIQLPRTNTSPSVYVMGTLGAKSASCTQSGTALTCNVGLLRKGRSTSVYFDIALPESAGTLDFSATASTTTSETSTANNGSSAVASLDNYTVAFSAPATVDNRHCTGTNLESFFECELFPSSLSSHVAVLEAGGTISFPDYPGYGGGWQVNGTELQMYYTDDLGALAGEFVGYGVSGTCWEGLTTFPGSTYVSPYEVCLQ